MQQRLERWTSRFHAAVLEALERHTLLRLHDGIDSRREKLQIMLFRPQHLAGEDREQCAGVRDSDWICWVHDLGRMRGPAPAEMEGSAFARNCFWESGASAP